MMIFFHQISKKNNGAIVQKYLHALPIGSMYAIYGDIYHQYAPNVSIYTIHGSYGLRTILSGDFFVAFPTSSPETLDLSERKLRVLPQPHRGGWKPWKYWFTIKMEGYDLTNRV
jgi:hypothetical protein